MTRCGRRWTPISSPCPRRRARSPHTFPPSPALSRAPHIDAECYKALGRKEEAAEWARSAVNMRVAGSYDTEAHDKSLALLKALDRAAYDAYMAAHPDGGAVNIK